VKRSNRAVKTQRGMTVFGGVILLMIISAVVLVVVRIAPAYIENYNVKRILGDLVDRSEVATWPAGKVRSTVASQLKISGVHDQQDMKIKVTKKGGGTLIRVTYRVRKPVVGNLDALVSFDDQVTLYPR